MKTSRKSNQLNKYKCDLCIKYFVSEKTISTHKEKYHADAKQTNPLSSMVEMSANDAHAAAVTQDQTTVCRFCTRAFRSKVWLQAHEDSCKNKEKTSDKTFLSKIFSFSSSFFSLFKYQFVSLLI